MGNNHTTISELEENEGENTPRCSIFCNTFLKTKKESSKSWRKEFRLSCRTLEPDYDWPERLCQILDEMTDKTIDLNYKNEALNFAMMKKDLESNSVHSNPLLLKNDTDLIFKIDSKLDNSDHSEKSFENFISFQNMQKKKKSIIPSKQDICMEDSGYLIERGVSSINKEAEKTSSLNISANQLIHSYPQTFITYKNYSILENNDQSALKSTDKKPWLKDKTTIALQKYRTLASLIERHLAETKHPLNHIKNEYIRYFIEYFQRKTLIKENIKPYKIDDLHKEIRSMVRDIKAFVWVFKEAINNFYDLECISKKYRTNDFELFSDYNIMNFIYSLLFTDELYSILFESLKTAEKYKEFLYKRNLDLLKNSPPEKFLVQDKFCLNQRTIEFFAKLYNTNPFLSPKEVQSFGNEANINKVKTKKLNYIELQTRIFPHLLMNSFNKSDFTAKSERNSRKSNNDPKKLENPYSSCIDLLKNLQFLKSPAHKMKVITEAFDMIEDNIRDYYESNGYDQKFIVIEPEDLISIIVYIMSQLSLSNMVTHSNFIEQFFNETNLNSKSACYLYSLKTGIEYILNAIDDNE